MRTLRFFTVVLVGLKFLTPAVVAQSQEASTTSAQPAVSSERSESLVKFDIEFGAESPFYSSGERWTKFVQHRDIPSNFTVDSLGFSIGQNGSRWSLVGTALDAGQQDQRYRLVLEKFGVSSTSFSFISWPNYVSRGVTSPYAETAPGVFSIPTATRIAFQNAPDDATRIGIMNDLVANTALGSLRARRQRFMLDQDYHLTDHWFLSANVMHERRTGRRPIGIGAYNRFGASPCPCPPGTGGASFFAFENELPEPIDYRNTGFRAGIGYETDSGMIRFDYTGSWFQNEIKNLVWTNPFQVTALDNKATPIIPGSDGRWRFDRDQLYTNPDNHANTLSFTGRAKLPGDSFISALLAYSMRRQNSPFDPYTLSNATFTDAPGDVTNPAILPQRSLNGEVNTTSGDAVLGTRHWKTVLLTAHYRAFNLNNEDAVIKFPGMINMGSFWTTGFDGAPVSAFEAPSSYLRQDASVEAVWRPSKQFQLRLAPTWESWNRSFRQMVRLNEWGVETGFIAEPEKWFNAKLNYRYGVRVPASKYIPAQNEFVNLRDFDQNHRITNNPSIVLNFGGKGPWLISANYGYMSQAYDTNSFGLSKYLRGSAGVDVNYAPDDRWGVVAYYNHERIGYWYRSIAKENDPFAFDPSDRWDRQTSDKVDSFGVGLNLLSRDQKWQFSANYDFSLANQRITTTNPQSPPVFPIDATGRNFPDVKSKYHELYVDASYSFLRNWRGGLRYIFSPYRLSDFATDNVTPYMPVQSELPLPGTIDPKTNGVRFLVLDSKYSSADAHMMGVYLRYSF